MNLTQETKEIRNTSPTMVKVLMDIGEAAETETWEQALEIFLSLPKLAQIKLQRAAAISR